MYTQYLLRSSYREGGRVKHRTYGNLSHLPEDIVDLIRRALRGEQFVPVTSAFEIRRTLSHGHVAAALGMARRLGLDRLLETRPSRRRDLVLAMIVSRILDPASKLATARSLPDETRFSSLEEVLRLGDVDEDDLYNALDWLETRQAGLERKLANRRLSEGCLVLYDLTSVAYTGNHCPLAEFGYPPEQAGRKRYRQMRVGLVCARDGVPVSVEVFPGNTKAPSRSTVRWRSCGRDTRRDGWRWWVTCDTFDLLGVILK